MKKIKYFLCFGMLLLLSGLLLTGCGGGGNGGGPSIITFTMPAFYDGLEGSEGSYPIPKNKEIRFYILSKIPKDNDPFLAETYFTGKTGSNLQSTLPKNLVGQSRYIFAVVFLEDEDSDGRFDPVQKPLKEIMDAVSEGKILFGYAADEYEVPKMWTLADGVTIDNFYLRGMAMGEATYTITFIMPESYQGMDDNKRYLIPEGKKVKFYALPDKAEPITAEHVFTGITGGNITCELPESLIYNPYYFYAVVVLEGDFDLQGKTEEEMTAALEAGEILFGKAAMADGEELYYLHHKISIRDFEFWGKGAGEPVTTFTIIMPAVYQGIQAVDEDEIEDENEIELYPIPPGKKLKFYIPPEPQENEDEDEDFIFFPEHTFTATTGPAKFEFELPSSLVGKERDIFAIVVLVGDYDLKGKNEEEIYQAILEEKILFGFTDDYHILNYGVIIDDLEFFGVPK